jgi:N-acetylmuramoyl-L-alanine amidase
MSSVVAVKYKPGAGVLRVESAGIRAGVEPYRAGGQIGRSLRRAFPLRMGLSPENKTAESRAMKRRAPSLSSLLAATALALAAGCGSPSDEPPRVIRIAPAQPEYSVVAPPPAQAPVDSPAAPAPAPAPVPVPVPEPTRQPPPPESPLPRALPEPVVSWARLDNWARQHGFTQVLHTARGKENHYDLRGPAGHLSLTAGSQLAQWNGVEFWLGFAPRIADGRAWISGLDAEKSFEPVLSPQFRLGNYHPTVVLDPGHGGMDAGTKSSLYNRFEKDYTLDWARRLASLLVAQGWKVVLTRTNDSQMALTNRVVAAETIKADLFVSLHFNSSFPRTDQSGVETYCLTPTGMPSSVKRDFEDNTRLVLANNAFDRENLQLALLLHRSVLESTRASDRGVRRARFMGVLKSQNRPAILIEGGYLSNPEEAGQIASPAYRQRLAMGVAKGLERVWPGLASSITQK